MAEKTNFKCRLAEEDISVTVKPDILTIEDCFLKDTVYESLTDPEQYQELNAANFKKLNEFTSEDRIQAKLPIYIINAHGLIRSNISLVAPTGYHKKITSVGAARRIEQLKSGFSIHGVDTEEGIGNFVTLKDNQFVISITPSGFNASCNDSKLREFLEQGKDAENNYDNLRKAILSDGVTELFSLSDSTMERSIYTPPNYSAVNKFYVFFDDLSDPVHGKQGSLDKWGIYKLDENFDTDIFHKTSPQLLTSNDQIKALYPHTLMSGIIKETVSKHTGIYLSEILEELGPGIYIDVGCSEMVMQIFSSADHEKMSSELISEEQHAKDQSIRVLFSCLYDDYNILSRFNILMWEEMFRKEKPVPLPSKGWPGGDLSKSLQYGRRIAENEHHRKFTMGGTEGSRVALPKGEKPPGFYGPPGHNRQVRSRVAFATNTANPFANYKPPPQLTKIQLGHFTEGMTRDQKRTAHDFFTKPEYNEEVHREFVDGGMFDPYLPVAATQSAATHSAATQSAATHSAAEDPQLRLRAKRSRLRKQGGVKKKKTVKKEIRKMKKKNKKGKQFKKYTRRKNKYLKQSRKKSRKKSCKKSH